jgi:hypothetical protein
MILTVVAAVLVPAARPPVDAAMTRTFLAFGSTGWDIGDTGTDPGGRLANDVLRRVGVA